LGAVTPFLSPLVSRLEAETLGKKPLRFVFYIEGNGMPPVHIQPKGIERKICANPFGYKQITAAQSLIDQPLTSPGVSLPEALTPLQKHIHRVSILQGLSGRVCGGGHFNAFGALGCYPQQAGAKDITIDAALAKAHPSVFQHIALGFVANPAPTTPPVFYACSASAPNTKVPHYQDPVLAYQMLFGKILGGNPEAEVGTQSMLLDFLAEDIQRLTRQLPYAESQKAKQYADAFYSIGQRQARLKEIDPKKIPAKRDALYGSLVETKRMESHIEIAATALITGLTNTVTLCSGAANYPTWKGLGASLDNHGLAHASGDNTNQIADNDAAVMRVKIRKFNVEMISKLVDQLEAIPEGNGSMMDHTVIVYLSDSAEDHHSTCFEWPMVVIGNLGNRLKLGNRFLNVPNYTTGNAHVTVSQFYSSLLHAAGAPVAQFGMKDRVLLQHGHKQEGPWTDVLA
jgi:hypothetical protein